MYTATEAQLKSEKQLNKQGFRFANWINAMDDENPDAGCMIMIKKPNHYSREYREIEPSGEIH